MEEALRILGKRIAAIRTKQGLTQEKLAEMVNYSTNHISKLELARTKPSFELLFKISKALDVELKDIFNFDEYKDPNDIKKEFEALIKTKKNDKIRLLYKIFHSIDV